MPAERVPAQGPSLTELIGHQVLMTPHILSHKGQPSSQLHCSACQAHPIFPGSPEFQGCPLPMAGRSALEQGHVDLLLAVPGPRAQWQKRKSSRLALDSPSLGTCLGGCACPSLPRQMATAPWDLQAGEAEVWHLDQVPLTGFLYPGKFPQIPSQREDPVHLWTVLALCPSPAQGSH